MVRFLTRPPMSDAKWMRVIFIGQNRNFVERKEKVKEEKQDLVFSFFLHVRVEYAMR